jgi:hypothetical protein
VSSPWVPGPDMCHARCGCGTAVHFYGGGGGNNGGGDGTGGWGGNVGGGGGEGWAGGVTGVNNHNGAMAAAAGTSVGDVIYAVGGYGGGSTYHNSVEVGQKVACVFVLLYPPYFTCIPS